MTIFLNVKTAMDHTCRNSASRRIITGIDLVIWSEHLHLQEISRLLGVTPTSGFEKGQTYIGREKRGSDIVNVERVRPFGVWHYCTSEVLDSRNVEDHAKLLAETFDSAKPALQQLISDPEYHVEITIWAAGYTFCLSAEYLSLMALLAENVTITCWGEEEME